MRLIHYSAKPLTTIRSMPHDPARCGAYKTLGLWVSVEGDYDWRWWCESESFGLDRLTHATEIILVANANIKHLRDARDIDRFTDRFHPKRRPKWDHDLDWLAIRERWNGLIIAPYIWSRRVAPHTSWYYGWDCASGVIWNADAIATIRPLEDKKTADFHPRLKDRYGIEG